MTNELTTKTVHLPPAFGGSLPGNLIELRSIIEQAKEAWLKKTQSEKTRVAYRNDLDQFLEFHGINPTHVEHMTKILPDQVTSWRDHLKTSGGRRDAEGSLQPAANSTIARKLTALRSFFSFLQNYGYRGANPAHPDFFSASVVSDKGVTPAIEEFETLAAAKALTRMHRANYNHDRPHSSLDYMTPAEFARQCSVSVACAPSTEHCRKNDQSHVEVNQPVLS